MSVIFLLLTVSTLVAGVFLLGFIWAVRKGQYDDDRSPAVRILLEDGVREMPEDKAHEAWSVVNGEKSSGLRSPVTDTHSLSANDTQRPSQRPTLLHNS